MSDLVHEHGPAVGEAVARYGLKALIETGLGDNPSGLRAAKAYSLQYHGCDVDPARVANARALDPAGKIEHLESLTYLRQVIPTIDVPVFIWLDAHCAYPALPESQAPLWPMFEELEIIRDLIKVESVIWIDDIHHNLDPENPAKNYDHQDIPWLNWPGDTRHTMGELYDVLKNTHSHEIVLSTLRFTPLPF